MEISAKPSLGIKEGIQKRWSPRAFADTPIPGEVLQDLFHSAAWAASSFNEQPWRFILTRKGTPAHEKLFSTLSEGNQKWAGKAPILVLTLAKKEFSQFPNPNRHAWYDLGASVALLSLQAAAHDVYLHQMGGFNAAQAHDLFEVPEEVEVATVIAMGYHGDPADLPEGVSEPGRDGRSRKPLEDFVFDGEMGKAFDFG